MKAPCHPRHRFVEACDPNSPSARKAFPNYCLTYLDHSLQKPSWFGTLRFEGAVAIASWSCSGRFGFGVLRINEKIAGFPGCGFRASRPVPGCCV